MYTGSTAIGVTEKSVFLEMKELIVILRINFDLAELDSVATELPFQDTSIPMIELEISPTNTVLEEVLQPGTTPEVLDSRPDVQEETSFLFSCQFCGKGFNIFLDMSEHVKNHFSEPDQSDGEESMLTYEEPDQTESYPESLHDLSDEVVMQPEPGAGNQEPDPSSPEIELTNPELELTNSKTEHYKCYTCDIEFLSFEVREEHITRKHLNPTSDLARFPKIILHRLETLSKGSSSTDQDKALIKDWIISENCKIKKIKLENETNGEGLESTEASQDSGIAACIHCQKMYLARSIDSHQDKCPYRLQSFCERKCSRCGQVFASKAVLQRHIACIHLASKLNELFGPDQTKCHICAKQFTGEAAWRKHMVFYHDTIPLSKDEEWLKIKPDRISASQPIPNNPCVPIKVEPPTYRKPFSNINNNKSKGKTGPHQNSKNLQRKLSRTFYCPVCPDERPSYQTLLIHICQIHYKDKIQTQIKRKTQCGMCDGVFKKEEEVQLHLVGVHNVLAHLIPSAENLTKKTIKSEPIFL